MRLRCIRPTDSLFPDDFLVLNIPFDFKPLFGIFPSKNLSTVGVLIVRVAFDDLIVLITILILAPVLSPGDC